MKYHFKKKLIIVLISIFLVACGERRRVLVVGSKNFTESVLLGEILSQKLELAGCRVDRRLNMGGTLVCHKAIESGAIDAYVEYSGTALTTILKEPLSSDRAAIERLLRQAYLDRDLHWGPSLGFNNTFAMIVRRADADQRGLRSISDLARVADRYRPGFGYEFVERPDGWTGLLRAYQLSFTQPPRTMDLGLTYKALAGNEIDLIAGNSTDGLIESLNLVILQDDRGFFPPYDAAIVRREDLEARCAGAGRALDSLAGKIDEKTMRRLNFEVDGKKRDVPEVVREFLDAL